MGIPAIGIATLAILLILFWTFVVWRVDVLPRAAGIFLMISALAWAQISVARQGYLREWGIRPVPIFFVVGLSVALVLLLVFSKLGRKLQGLPLIWLIGFQAFRLPLELSMHQAYVDGLMPVQMSYSGRNFDILTGVTAVIVAVLTFKNLAPRWLVVAWNLLGSLLLVNVVVIAVISTPVFAAFGQDNLNMWIADAPYVWLPGILVPSALAGHLLLWRKVIAR